MVKKVTKGADLDYIQTIMGSFKCYISQQGDSWAYEIKKPNPDFGEMGEELIDNQKEVILD